MSRRFSDSYGARPERFELPTAWFVARYSIQLSYGARGEGCEVSGRVDAGVNRSAPPEAAGAAAFRPSPLRGWTSAEVHQEEEDKRCRWQP